MGGEQIRQQLAGVVEPGRAVVSHVREEPRRAEATGQGERGAGHQGRCKSRHQRVGVEREASTHSRHPQVRVRASSPCGCPSSAVGVACSARPWARHDVPEVKSNTQRASTSGSAGATGPFWPAVVIGPGLLQRLLERLTRGRRIVSVGESVRDEDPTWERHSLSAPPAAAPRDEAR